MLHAVALGCVLLHVSWGGTQGWMVKSFPPERGAYIFLKWPASYEKANAACLKRIRKNMPKPMKAVCDCGKMCSPKDGCWADRCRTRDGGQKKS